MDEVQHVTHFTKHKLTELCERAGWRAHHIGTFNGLAPFIAPISRRLALAMENIEFSISRVFPQNLLFCVAKKKV